MERTKYDAMYNGINISEQEMLVEDFIKNNPDKVIVLRNPGKQISANKEPELVIGRKVGIKVLTGVDRFKKLTTVSNEEADKIKKENERQQRFEAWKRNRR